ncbi:cupin domain-containing protein [uncultured Tateyamaria sp.]|uniref:cupin domain-containing protein n=1 Tax=uncultured Tateyamaria sp. TaxID=455651 RepID=UPI00261EA590|nr:cupin domain-containing protein [uncultured Tateyamaria sp.]
MTVIKQGSAQIDSVGEGSVLGPYRAELISDSAGLTQFGAFIEELPPGSRSSHTHWHKTEDEMVLILTGRIVLTEDGVETTLGPGDAACWKAGTPTGHHMENRSDAPVRYVVIGTRSPADEVTYPTLDRVLHHDRTHKTRRYTTLAGDPADAP